MAASEASLDEQLELKKRARRRLVGAAALALLAAIVLPMVMDHEPRPTNQDIQVRIPSQDAPTGIAARVLPGKPAATPLPPASDAAPAEQPKSEAKPEVKPETKPEPPAKVATVPAAKPAEKAQEKPAAKPAEKATDKPVEKTAVAPADKAEKPADKKKTEESRASTALAGDGAEQWVIQLGAYKEAGNVKLLMAKLKGMGVPAYTEKFDSPQGPRTRVRAGPFPNKDAAEKAKVKVKIVGVDGPVAPK